MGLGSGAEAGLTGQAEEDGQQRVVTALSLGQKLKPAPGSPQTGNVRGSGAGGVNQGPGSGATMLLPCGTEADAACGEAVPV